MPAIPQHSKFFCISSNVINGVRQSGEVIDADELQIRHAIGALVSSGQVSTVPYESELVEVDGILFINQEFADAYSEYVAVQESGTESIDTSAEEGGDGVGGDDESYDSHTVPELRSLLTDREIHHTTSMTKAELVDLLEADDADKAMTVEERLHALGKLNKADLTFEAERLGVEVDPEWTMDDILTATEMHLSQ